MQEKWERFADFVPYPDQEIPINKLRPKMDIALNKIVEIF